MTGSAESLLVNDRSAAAEDDTTGVVIACVLSAEGGSDSFALTATTLAADPSDGTTVIATTLPVPAASVPSAQLTVPAFTPQLPWPGVAETNAALSGNVSVSATLVAEAGPPFVTTMV